MKKPIQIFIALCIFHLAISLTMSFIAQSSFLADYHNGQGLWNFSLDSFNYHKKALDSYESLANGEYSTWWDTDSYRHTEYIGLTYFLFYPSPVSFAPVNAIAWALSVTCIYLTAMILYKDNRKLSIITALIFGLWPSNLLHATQLLRDPFFNLGILVFLLGWITIMHGHRKIVYSFMVAAGLIFSVGIREEPFWLLVFCSLLAVVATILWNRESAPYALLALMLTGVFYNYPISVAHATEATLLQKHKQDELLENEKVTAVKKQIRIKLGAEYQAGLDKRISKWFSTPFKEWTFETKKDRLFALLNEHGKELDSFLSKWQKPWEYSTWLPAKIEHQAINANTYRNGFLIWYLEPGSSLIDSNVIFRSLNDVAGYIPRALTIGFLAPFPNQWLSSGKTGGKIIRVIGGMEMLTWYALMAGFAIFLVKAPPPVYVKIWLLIFMVIMILPLGLFVPNIGTLFRMRFIYMTPILIGGVYGIMTVAETYIFGKTGLVNKHD